jgi:hypothetical protein
MSNFYKPPAQTDPAPKNYYRLTGSTLRFDTTIDHERVDANNPDLSVVIDLTLGSSMPLKVIDLRGLPVNDKGDKVMLDGRTINRTGAFLIEAPDQLDLNKGTGFKLIREGESVTLGRKSHEDRFKMPDTVSRMHAEISYIDGVLTLTDLGSANATFASSRLNMATDKSDGVEVGSFAGPQVIEGLGGGAVGLAAAEAAVPVTDENGMVVSFEEWQQRKSSLRSAQVVAPDPRAEQQRPIEASKPTADQLMEDLIGHLSSDDKQNLRCYAIALQDKRRAQQAGNGDGSMYAGQRAGASYRRLSPEAQGLAGRYVDLYNKD